VRPTRAEGRIILPSPRKTGTLRQGRSEGGVGLSKREVEMATRAIVRVYDEENRPLCAVYKHWDGYPEGLGEALREFLNGRTIVNGIPGGITVRSVAEAPIANTMAGLAAQLMCFLKSESPVGDVYVYPPDYSDVGEEYVYHVRFAGLGKEAQLEIEEVE